VTRTPAARHEATVRIDPALVRPARLTQEYDTAMAMYRAAAWADAVQQLQTLEADEPTFRDVKERLA
jgi:hypothetical protein